LSKQNVNQETALAENHAANLLLWRTHIANDMQSATFMVCWLMMSYTLLPLPLDTITTGSPFKLSCWKV
jgi:hypothetical protein